jgi:hypothetical protein
MTYVYIAGCVLLVFSALPIMEFCLACFLIPIFNFMYPDSADRNFKILKESLDYIPYVIYSGLTLGTFLIILASAPWLQMP